MTANLVPSSVASREAITGLEVAVEATGDAVLAAESTEFTRFVARGGRSGSLIDKLPQNIRLLKQKSIKTRISQRTQRAPTSIPLSDKPKALCTTLAAWSIRSSAMITAVLISEVEII